MSTFIFVCTCSSSFADLKESGEVHFEWQGNPSFEELLLPWPSGADRDFAVQKAGHALAFFILACGLLQFLPRASAAVISILYALATEILQLFFTRSGRILDVMVDCAGIAIAVIIIKGIEHLIRRHRHQNSVSQNRT
jgi:VanZ like family